MTIQLNICELIAFCWNIFNKILFARLQVLLSRVKKFVGPVIRLESETNSQNSYYSSNCARGIT